MPRVRAITSWADRKVGEEFEASEFDARLLCASDALGGQKAELVDRAMTPTEPAAEPPAKVEPESIERNEKRRYLRRDLRAQK